MIAFVRCVFTFWKILLLFLLIHLITLDFIFLFTNPQYTKEEETKKWMSTIYYKFFYRFFFHFISLPIFRSLNINSSLFHFLHFYNFIRWQSVQRSLTFKKEKKKTEIPNSNHKFHSINRTCKKRKCFLDELKNSLCFILLRNEQIKNYKINENCTFELTMSIWRCCLFESYFLFY